MNCVNAAALNVAVGRVVCGAAVEGDPGPRKTRKVNQVCRASQSQYLYSLANETNF